MSLQAFFIFKTVYLCHHSAFPWQNFRYKAAKILKSFYFFNVNLLCASAVCDDIFFKTF